MVAIGGCSYLCLQWVLSVAADRVRHLLLWHLARLVTVVPVDLLQDNHSKFSKSEVGEVLSPECPPYLGLVPSYQLGR